MIGAQLGKTKNDASHANFSGNRVVLRFIGRRGLDRVSRNPVPDLA
jgi:hypothetical protein